MGGVWSSNVSTMASADGRRDVQVLLFIVTRVDDGQYVV